MALYSHPMYPKSRRNAFTLIEMLTVIAIMSMLAAILFPAFSRVRENARRTSCQSNLKQIGMGINQYSADNDGLTLPAESGGVAWPILLFPYTKSSQIFVCPAAALGEATPCPTFLNGGDGAASYFGGTTGDLDGGSASTVQTLSYARNCITTDMWSNPAFQPPTATKCGFTNPGGTDPNAAVPETAVEDPTGTIEIVDGMASTNSGQSMIKIDKEKRTDRYADADASKTSYRHNIGFDALYGDSHVKWRPYGSTSPGEWSIQGGD